MRKMFFFLKILKKNIFFFENFEKTLFFEKLEKNCFFSNFQQNFLRLVSTCRGSSRLSTGPSEEIYVRKEKTAGTDVCVCGGGGGLHDM